MNSSDRTYYIYLRIINHFNITFSNKTDFSIIVELINRASVNKPIAIGELAEACHVSQATISRFVRKLGFADYQDFNYNFYRAVEIAQLKRRVDYTDTPMSTLVEEAKSNAISNITHTHDNLNLDILNQIVDKIRNAKNSIFIGTPENISHFARLQKDLIANSIPAFIFYDPETQLEFLEHADESTCAIFFVLSNSYLSVHQRKIDQLLKKNATLILFTQEPIEDTNNDFNIVYQFGSSETFRYGEYSLEYLSEIMTGLLYKHRT